MVNNKHFKIISITLGLILIIMGILLIMFKPNILIVYPIALFGTGSYLSAVGLASLLLTKMYYSNTSIESVQRNKYIRMIEILTYSIMGIILAVTITLCFIFTK